MKKLAAEFVGTFALVFIGAGSAALGAVGVEGVALAHGLTLMAMVYAFGSLSGAHVNPAVTFGLWLRSELDVSEAVGYWLVQLLGGIVAGFALLFVFGGPTNNLGATLLSSGVSPLRGLFLEAILTFFLVTSVLRSAVHGHAGNAMGAAIGLTLAAAILIGGPLTGASLNPARTLGPAVAAGQFADLWLYFVGPLAGGAIAAGLDGWLEA
jgi:aquaporin Z